MSDQVWERVSPVFTEPPDEGRRCITPFVAKSRIVDRVIEGAGAEVAALGATLLPSERVVVAEALLDVGGMATTTRKMYELPVDGLVVHVPAKDVEVFIAGLTGMLLEPRLNVAGALTIGSWPMPILADAEWVELLRAALYQILPEAQAFADAEAAEFQAKFIDKPHPNVQVRPRGPLPKADA